LLAPRSRAPEARLTLGELGAEVVGVELRQPCHDRAFELGPSGRSRQLDSRGAQATISRRLAASASSKESYDLVNVATPSGSSCAISVSRGMPSLGKVAKSSCAWSRS